MPTSGDIEYINAEKMDDIAQKEEVFFVYLHPYASSKHDLVRIHLPRLMLSLEWTGWLM